MKKRTLAELKLRKAELNDGPFLLAVRNNPKVRSQSKTQAVISDAMHRAWFDRQLKSPGSLIWILEHRDRREGYVRAQKFEAGAWLLSIALQTSSRGKGHGTWAVQEGCRLLRKRYGARCLVAEVLAKNSAARQLFKSAGFVEKAVLKQNGLDVVRLELEAGDRLGLSARTGEET